MARTVKDLDFTGSGSAVLVSYGELPWVNGTERALWVDGPYVSRNSPYELCDDSERVPLDPDEDLDELVAEWKATVGWDEVPPLWNVEEGRWQHNIDAEQAASA